MSIGRARVVALTRLAHHRRPATGCCRRDRVVTDSSTAEVRDKGPLLLLSQRFAAWLAAADVCLALTTYQAGRLFFIGRKDDGGVRAHGRIIEQCQGLWTDGQTPWTSAPYMPWPG